MGVRYSFQLDFASDWQFGVQPIVGYQFHQSPIPDPAFAGDGWSYGGRFDAGRAFEVFGLHGFADLGLSATTRSQADAALKLDLAAGVDLDESWQAGLGYFADWAPGTIIDYGAYQKHELAAYIRWRFEPEHAIALSIARTIWVDRTVDETVFSVSLWSFFLPDSESDE